VRAGRNFAMLIHYHLTSTGSYYPDFVLAVGHDREATGTVDGGRPWPSPVVGDDRKCACGRWHLMYLYFSLCGTVRGA
jgi:hypothetical protein